MEQKHNHIVIAHHIYTWDSLVEEELLHYVQSKAYYVTYISHPFKTARDKLPLNTMVDVYENGSLTKRFRGPACVGPEILFFLKDFFFSLYFFLFCSQPSDLYIGVDNLNAFIGLVLKKLSRTKRVVYYVIDYVPQRFNNRLLNTLYHWIDFFCVKHCDQTWNLTDAVTKARLRDGLPAVYMAKQCTVPIGCHQLYPKRVNMNFRGRKRIVFLGALIGEQGVDMLIESIPAVLEKIPNLLVIVIGSGELLPYLHHKIKELRIEKNVTLEGYIKDNRKVDNILATCHVGVAPYRLFKESMKHYGDPGKIKTYLGAGLPIVMTNISPIAHVIRAHQAGFVVNDTVKDFSSALITLLSHRTVYEQARKNAISLAKRYDWHTIFDTAFAKLLSYG